MKHVTLLMVTFLTFVASWAAASHAEIANRIMEANQDARVMGTLTGTSIENCWFSSNDSATDYRKSWSIVDPTDERFDGTLGWGLPKDMEEKYWQGSIDEVNHTLTLYYEFYTVSAYDPITYKIVSFYQKDDFGNVSKTCVLKR